MSLHAAVVLLLLSGDWLPGSDSLHAERQIPVMMRAALLAETVVEAAGGGGRGSDGSGRRRSGSRSRRQPSCLSRTANPDTALTEPTRRALRLH